MAKKFSPNISYIIIAICILVHLLIYVVDMPNMTEAAILLGAFYKPMILCGEWIRLLTVGFIHMSVYHLFINLFSLYNLGRYLENRIRPRDFIIILLLSIVGGSLFQFLTGDNQVCVGLSGGLYGLMGTMLYIFYIEGAFANPYFRSYTFRILMINLFINFMPGVAYMAHIGGMFTGALVAMTLLKVKDNPSIQINASAALCAFIILLGIMTYRTKSYGFHQIYIGSDIRVLQKEVDLGFESHAKKMAKALDNLYDTDGIIEQSINGGNAS